MTKADDGKFVEENNALMANGRAKPSEKTTLKTFIYNKRDGTFLGRTGKSWAQILIFYVIFYICLAAFWLTCLYIFLKTIDPSIPRYYGEGTIIGVNPGVGYQPWLKNDPESTLIKFNMRDNRSYEHYTSAIKNYLAKYNENEGTRDCDKNGGSNQDVVYDSKASSTNSTHKFCRFKLDKFTSQHCNDENDYGFAKGEPCIILSLNRLIGWIPESYDEEVPEQVRARYKKGSIAFNCEGISEPDKELQGRIRYIPPEGIPGRYYPYAYVPNDQKGNLYQQPLAMVKFTHLPRNRLVMIECAAFAKNIQQDRESRAGMITFELFLQDFDPEPEGGKESKDET